ncbi:phosphoglycerate mutase [Deinococcus malanensis]|uniref:Phosphoglycerate mutase n=1 Tax=Deinococcus malanensis TaxID=1706855 RepID=A0ABQ2EHE0_9DEIO|nr:histidine phosphatase family protein [Deinococcus malanensis]GGK12509.1 phosphoglycerate mutase [Deinococcus malanensis]
MPRTLHLVKHGQPYILAGVPAHEWQLAEGALTGLPGLISRLRPVPDVVVSSEEAKAVSTGQGLAAALGVPSRRMLGLHEHLRYTAPVYPDPADFQAAVERFFDHPAQVVFGEESADDARRRFANAVEAVMRRQTEDSVAIVAHGTVISLLVAHGAGLDPRALWKNLGLLGALTLDWPTLRLREPLD